MSYVQAVRTCSGQAQSGSQTDSDREEMTVGEETEREKPELIQQELRRRSAERGQPQNTQEEGVGD